MKEFMNNITPLVGKGNIHPSAIIHPTAIIEAGAVIEADVKVGPYCVVGAEVILQKGVELKSHVVVAGVTTVGENSCIYPFAVIGEISQDMKFYASKEYTPLVIGKNNIIREHVTMHMGTPASTGTIIGDNNLFMVGVHVAHDCIVGNNCFLANNVGLAGHVEVDDFAIIGGQTGVLQFTKIGRNAMVGGQTGLRQDVLPYSIVEGAPAYWQGLNLVGLKRKGFTLDQIKSMQEAYNILFSDKGVVADRVKEMKEKYSDLPEIAEIVKFIETGSKHSFHQPVRK